MPVMNGIEATHAIIDYEEQNNLNHTPIVALTANAVAGDKEKFLSEGMDDYIPKPFEEYMLDNVLNKYIQLKVESKEEIKTEEVVVDIFEYSIEDSANALGLKLPIFKTILKTFISSIDKDIDNLKSKIEEDDKLQIQQVAHKIKGAAGNLKINNIYELTKDIELCAKENLDCDYSLKIKKLEKCVKDIKNKYDEAS